MRTWIVIPAMGAVAALVGFAIGSGSPVDPIAAGLCGAAIAGMIRTLYGDSPASLVAAVVAALLAIVLVGDRSRSLAVPCLALGGAAWTFAELTRTSRSVATTTTSPIVAMLPATIAALLQPAFVALVPIAGWRLVTAPWQRPAWIVAVPILGGIATLVAVVAGVADGGTFGALGHAWFGERRPIDAGGLASSIGHGLGPLVAVAALAGLAQLVRIDLSSMPRLRADTNLAIACCIVGLLLHDLRAGGASAVTLGFAATSAGLAVGRLAATIPIPSGQAIAGATVGLLVVLPQAWIVIERVVA